MLPKQKSIGINTGLLLKKSSGNYFFNTDFIIYSKKGNHSIYSFEYSRQIISYKTADVPVENYSLEVGYSFNLIADRTKSFLINSTISATGGYENINKGETLLYDGALLLNESSLVYGGSARLSIETYLSDRIVLTGFYKAKIVWNTSLEKIRPSVGLGFKINL
ncbi:conjugal transfer protein TraO [Chryseobacterium sp. CFS15]|uniref:conjugal transfer protein TraO n=1 Tax=Chryseobacterium sp. CFS15 TaxID=2986946 RepID=UPI002808C81B|nr:conjugal transfer protein TraO [Chryseobacterium sp. CFS15]MDQ8141533.1 conjugal transfer protein TraO [Chryseobacterium sp. CFS15]